MYILVYCIGSAVLALQTATSNEVLLPRTAEYHSLQDKIESNNLKTT